MSHAGQQPAVLSACSLVSSLGLDAVSGCAAARAGIVRTSRVDTFVVGTLDDADGATVHAAPMITHGFEGDARLLRLLQAALEDLHFGESEAPWSNDRAGVYLSIPDSDRCHAGHALIPDDELREREVERFKQATDQRSSAVDESERAGQLLQRAMQLAGWTRPVELRSVSTSGHTGVAELLELARKDLADGTTELAIVGGVDSWLDHSMLLWLERRKRLKSATTPVGLAPGEASGFLILETGSHAKARDARPVASLGLLITDREELCQLSAETSLGEALSRVVSGVAAHSGWSPERSPWLIVDQNGENYRAQEWGYALTRLVGTVPALQQPDLWFPVASFGDTGAATGVIQACTAMQAFTRGYAPSDRALLLASGEAGHRTALFLEAHPA